MSGREVHAALAFVALLALGCVACSGGGGDADSEIDTSFEFGETTPCVNEARPGEVCIPGGTYLMGCVPGDNECEENEKPLVAVTLSPFFIDKKEATIKELINWMNGIRDDPGIVTNPYFGWTDGTTFDRLWGSAWDISGTTNYVEYVLKDEEGTYYYNAAAEGQCPNQGGINAAAGGFTWLGAKKYCEWKGGRLLPTEAQWEAAARGQTFNEFPCGSDLAECWWGVYACCSETEICGGVYENLCHCCAPFSADHAETCLSPFGLIGMYGNALEWTKDYESSDHSACVGGCEDPESAGDGSHSGAVHLLKGGSMGSDEQIMLRICHFSRA